MTGFLTRAGERLAERWLTGLVPPGLVFLAVAVAAWRLRHRHATELRRLRELVNDLPAGFTDDPVHLSVLLAVALGAAALAGWVAQGLSTAVLLAWCRTWPGRSASAPVRGTRIGQPLRRLDRRVQAQYGGLRLALVWPRLWLLLDEPVRTPVREARDAVDAAARLAAWGLLYLALGVIWWPAAPLGGVVWIVAWRRARTTVDAFAAIVEATVDISQHRLAATFGLTLPDGRYLQAEQAAMINDQLHKGG